jgi:RHS repeat-associated protein
MSDKTVMRFAPHSPNGLVSITDPNGNALTFNVTSTSVGGTITRVTSPSGRYIQFTYDAAGRITLAADNIGRSASYSYDSQGRLASATDAAGQTESYGYDSLNRMTTVTDKRGHLMATNVYDSNGRVSQQTLADGAVWQFSYQLDELGNVTQTTITDPRSFIEQDTFNSDGYLVKQIRALGQPEQQTMTIQRDAANVMLSRTDPLNRVTQFAHDGFGNVTSVTLLAGTGSAVTHSFSYGPTSQLTGYTDPLGHTRSWSYDWLGDLTSATDPLTETVRFSYDTLGKPLSITTALNKVTQLAWDQGDLASITDPQGRTISIFNDAVGRPVGFTDPLGHNARYDYDSMDRVLRATDSVGGITTYTYDANDNLLSVQDPRAAGTHVFTYDIRNRLQSYTDPNGQVETYHYDGMGNLTSKVDRKNQATTFSYDALNRVQTVTYPDNSSLTVSWDAGDRATQLVDSTTGTLVRQYDGLDRLKEESGPQGQVDYQYDAAGRRTQLTVAGASPVTYQYDNDNQLTQVTQGANVVGFTYDAAGRRSQAALPNGITATYSYDDADELTGISYDNGATHVGDLSYSYDAAGRRVGQSGSLANLLMPSTVPTATYDAANRLTSWGSTSLTYDNDGNLTGLGAATFTWDARNQLVATSDGGGGFSYDAIGRRTSRILSGTTTSYVHDGYNPTTVSGNFLLQGSALDELYAQISSSGTTTLLSDALGTTVALTDGTGTINSSYSYAPYGTASRSGTQDTSFQFTGRENDLDTGLYYYRSRYYSPVIARFISEDPIGLAGGSNLYVYADGNPISENDPTGDCPWCIGALIGAGIDLATQLAANGGNWHCISWGQVGVSAALGAVGGGLGGKGLSSALKGLSRPLKGDIGEALSMVENRLAGSRLVNTQTKIPGQRTIADSTWDSLFGNRYYVESKFGKSTLTSAQRAAAKALGDQYQVERWGYPFFERVGAYFGGTAGGLAGNTGAADGNSGCGCN